MATRGVAVLVAVLLAIVAEATLVSAEVRDYNWTVSYIEAAPDCFEKTVLGINGEFQGEGNNIKAIQGDTVRVTIINHLVTEGITMHWHGIRQINSTWADGTAQVSQCPIVYGESFTYEFIVDRPGTYFYHGHAGVQRAAGFYGSLIVDLPEGIKEPYNYTGEHMIILNDWWHLNVMDQERGLESHPTVWVGNPQSILLGGRGRYNCSNVNGSEPLRVFCNQTSKACDPPHIWRVTNGSTYRLRLASVTSLSSLNFKIENHTMQVVEADGHNVEPFYTDNLDIYSGETYSVLVVCNGTSDNYHLAVDFRGRDPKNLATGLGILNYNNTNATQPNTPLPKGPVWNNVTASVEQARKYRFRTNNTDPTSHPYNVTEHVVTRQLVLLNEQRRDGSNVRWALNNITYVPLATPLLSALVYKIPNAINSTVPPDYPTPGYNITSLGYTPETNQGSGYYQFNTGDVVEVILQNGAMHGSDDSDLHPWHLHGHDFWIMGYGDGKFGNTTEERDSFNTVDPPSRNNVALYPRGWTAIRFKLDNPGAWPFHCHIEWHFHSGMGVMFVHGIDQVRNVPSSTLGCGLTKTLMNSTIP